MIRKTLSTIWKTLMPVLLLMILTWAMGVSSAQAAACNDQADGDWDNAGTWDCGIIPDADDDVTIDSHTVDLDSDEVSSTVTISGGNLDVNSYNLTVDAGWTYSSGGFMAGTGTVSFIGAQTIDAGSNAFNDVVFNTGVTEDITITGTMDVDGTLTIYEIDDLNGSDITIAGNFLNMDSDIGGVTQCVFDGTGDQTWSGGGSVNDVNGVVINKSSGTLTVEDDVTVRRDWTYVQGIVNMTTATMTGAQYGTIESYGMTFYNVILNAGNSSHDYTFVGTMDVDGTFTITGVDAMTGADITVAGNFINTDTSIRGSSQIIFDGTGDQTWSGGGSENDINGIVINKASGTLTVEDDAVINGGWTLTQGTVDMLTTTLTFEDPYPDGLTAAGMSFYNLIFDKGNEDFNITGTLDINGTFTINGADQVNSGPITVAGNLISNDTDVNGSVEIYLDGTGDQTVSGAAGATWPHGSWTITKASGTVTLSSIALVLDATGQDLSVLSGTLDTAGLDVTVDDVIDIDGGFRLHGDESLSYTSFSLDSTSSTVEFYDTSVTALVTDFPASSFYNLILGSGKIHEFATGMGNEITVNGVLTANGSSGSLTRVRAESDAASDWYIDVQGSAALGASVIVRHSNASSGNQISAIGSIDRQDNTNWDFGVTATTPFMWIGDVDADNFNDGSHWTGGSVPGASDMAIFTGTLSTTSMSIDTAVSLASIEIRSDYTGTITQNANTVTIGTSDWNQVNGQYVGGTNMMDIMGTFTLSGGTFTGGVQTIEVGAGWLITGGTFGGSSSVHFDSAYGDNIYEITSNSQSFNNVKFDDNGGGTTWELQDAMTVDGTFQLNDGNFDTNSSGDYGLTSTGTFNITGGNFAANASTINIYNDFDIAETTGLFDAGTATIYLLASSSISNPHTNNSLSSLDQADGITTTLTDDVVAGTFISGNGTSTLLTNTSGKTFLTSAITNNGFVCGGGSQTLLISFAGTSLAGGDYGDCNISITTATTASLSGNVSTTGNMQINLSINDATNRLYTNGYDLTVGSLGIGRDPNNRRGGSLYLQGTSSLTVDGNVSINDDNGIAANALIVDTSGTNTISVGGDWDLQEGAEFDAQNSTITFNGTSGTSTITIDETSGTFAFANLTVNDDDGGSDLIVQMAGTLDMTGTLTITNGSLDLDGYEAYIDGSVNIDDELDASSGTGGNSTIHFGGDWDMTGGTFTSTDSSVFFTGTMDANLYSDSKSFNNFGINDGLVGYWKFDEPMGDVAYDSSGNSYDGDWIGASIAASSSYSGVNFANEQSLDISLANDYVSVGNSINMAGYNAFTVATWVNYDGSGTDEHTIFSNWSGTKAAILFRLEPSNDTIEAYVQVETDTEIGAGFNDLSLVVDQWHHVAITYDTTNGLQAYVDGTKSTTSYASAAPLNSDTSGNLFFGRSSHNATDDLTGFLDDLRFYNRALSQSEISVLAAGNLPQTGVATLTLEDTLDVTGSLIINSGTLDVNSAENNAISVAGNWINNGGDFIPQNGTVTLDGNDQAINSSGTFYALTKSVATSGTLTFGQQSTTTITNALTLNGASGQELNLRSSATGTFAYIDPQGTRTLSYLNVQDNTNSNATAMNCTNNCTDSGNNVNWAFVSEVRTWDGGGGDNNWSTDANWSSDTAPTAADTARFDTTSTADATIDTDFTVAWVDVNSGYTGTITQASGQTLTVDGTFDLADGTFIGGDSTIDINGTFTIESGASFTMTTGTMSVADNFTLQSGSTFTKGGTLMFDADLTFVDATSPQQDLGALVVDPTTTLGSDLTATSLTILANDTLVTDGYELTISGTIDINGTLDASNGTDGNTTIQVGGPWDSTGGLFINTNSEVIFTGTSGTVTYDITPNAQSFNNVKFDDNGGGTTWELQDAMTVDGTFQLNDGILDTNTTGSFGITITGSLNATGGMIEARGSTITANADFLFTTDGTFNYGTSLIDLTGSGDFYVYPGVYDLNVAASGQTSRLITANLQVYNIMTVGSGILTDNSPGKPIYLNRTDGVPMILDSAASISVDGFWYVTTGSIAAGDHGSPVNLGGISRTMTLTGTFAASNLYINNDLMSSTTITLDTTSNNFPITVATNLDLGDGSGNRIGRLILNDSTLVVGNRFRSRDDGGYDNILYGDNATIRIGGDFDAQYGITMNLETSTVIFDDTSGTSTITFPSTGTVGIFPNVTINDGDGGSNLEVVMSGTLDMTGTLTITDGSLDLDGYEAYIDGNVNIDDELDASSGTGGNSTIHFGGDWDMTGGTFTATDSTVIFTGTMDVTLTSDGKLFNDFTLDNLTTDTTSLEIYLKFDETAANSCVGGEDACDSSGNDRDGDWNGTATSDTSLAPLNFTNVRSITLDGNSDYVQVDSPSLPTGDFTYAAWINLDSTIFESIAMVSDGSGSNELLFAVKNNKLETLTNDMIQVKSASSVGTGWVHVATTRSGSTIRQYINGTLDIATGTDGGALNFGACALLIGTDNDFSGCTDTLTDFFDGRMDDFRVYSRALSGDEIRALAFGNELHTGTSTVTLQDALDVDGTLLINSGTLDVGSDNLVSVAGNWINVGGSFVEQMGTVTFDGSSVTQSVIEPGSFYDVKMSNTKTLDLEEDLNSTGNFQVDTGTTTLSSSGGFVLKPHDVDVNSTFALASVDVQLSGSWDATTGAFSSAGEVIFTSTDTAETILSNTSVFNDLTFYDSTEGLIAHFKFDETAANSCVEGEDACDSSANNRDGTWNGTATSNTSLAPLNYKNVRSIDLDGNSDYVQVDSPSLPTGDFTYAAWINLDTATDEMIFMSGNSSGHNEFYLVVSTGAKLYALINNTTTVTSTTTIATGQWYHVGVTRSGGTIQQYIQGSTTGAGSGTDATVLDFDSCPLLIGVDADGGCTSSLGNYLDGRIDDARIYNRALSAAEMATLANGDQPQVGTTTFTLQDTLDINGTLMLNSGTLDVGSNREITIAGNWVKNGGDFIPQNGTVTLDGTDQEINASGTFYNLTKTESTNDSTDVTLTIGQGSTQTVTNMLTLDGLDTDDRINIRTSTTGSMHIWDVTSGDQTVSWVDVQDSAASSNDIITTNSVDSGNTDRFEATPRWVFGPLRGSIMIVE